MRVYVCISYSISLHQVCICSSLHWKEFKPFSGCCPFAIKASTRNRSKICNGFRITRFSQIPKNGNSFSSSLWRWGGLRILWKKRAFQEPADGLHCLLLMPEFISWSLKTAKEVTGGQRVKHPGLSSIKTRTSKKSKYFCRLSRNMLSVTQGGYSLLGHVFAHTHFSRETVTLPPNESYPPGLGAWPLPSQG